MDGSTDEATVEQETLFVRFCCQGDTVTKFLTIASTSSADLYTFVTNILKTHELNQNISFIGFGCDGAANMMGKKGGLVTLLQKDFPELLACHCLAHRLELSFRDVVKADKKYERLSTLLLGIFYFYKRSPKQRKNLRHTFEVMNVKGTLPHRVSGSRWMPHMQRALKSLFTSFPGYVSHLQNESHTNSKAEGHVQLSSDCLCHSITGRFESLGETVTVSTIQGCDIGRCPSHGAVNCQPPRIPEGEEE